MFTIDSAAFRKDLERSASTFKTSAHHALTRTTAAAATYAKLSRLYKSHTYGLRSSIHEKTVGGWSIQVIADAPYAGFIENGTRSHFIFPKRRKALRFEWGGNIVFRSWVFHPGTKSRPFMKEARDKAEPLFERLAREAVDSAFT